jgi:toxin ParE1/3/4
MSARKRLAVLTKKAQADYRQILLYSVQTWGEEQQRAYNAALLRALAVIADNPNIGRARPDLPSGYRAFPVEQHVILYRITTRGVSVARIVHSRMDVRQALRRR